MKRAIRSARARADIDDALAFYMAEAPHVADDFVNALEKATSQIERQPGIGSSRYALELHLPHLRHWRLNRFPYAIFYLAYPDHLVVVRVVHMSRDIPASLGFDESGAGD